MALAQMFAERVVGLKAGEIAFDGPPEALTSEVLTTICGEEDWQATIRKVEEEEGEAAGRPSSMRSSAGPGTSRR